MAELYGSLLNRLLELHRFLSLSYMLIVDVDVTNP